MALGSALGMDEGALICDFAEVYHIYDYGSLPASLAATLFAGLGDDSRIKLKINGARFPAKMFMLARVVDALNVLVWMLSEDGMKGINKPASVVKAMLGESEESENAYETFSSYDDFRARWNEL